MSKQITLIMEINSIKILSTGVTIEGTDGKGKVTFERKEPHDDFVESIRKLNRHLVVIDEVFNENPKNLLEADLEPYKCNGFSLHGTGESMSIIIKGQKKLSTGSVYSFNTPRTYLVGDDYIGERQLRKDIKKAIGEAKLFLEGKIEPTPIEAAIIDNGKGDK